MNLRNTPSVQKLRSDTSDLRSTSSQDKDTRGMNKHARLSLLIKQYNRVTDPRIKDECMCEMIQLGYSTDEVLDKQCYIGLATPQNLFRFDEIIGDYVPNDNK